MCLMIALAVFSVLIVCAGLVRYTSEPPEEPQESLPDQEAVNIDRRMNLIVDTAMCVVTWLIFILHTSKVPYCLDDAATPGDKWEAFTHGFAVRVLFLVSAVALLGTLMSLYRFCNHIFTSVVITAVEISGIVNFAKFRAVSSPTALCQGKTNWEEGIDWDAFATNAIESILHENAP